jgi:hypothetical protein
MESEDSEDENELGIDMVTDWTSQNPIFLTDKNFKSGKRMIDEKTSQFDCYWGSNWGQMLRDPTVNDPSSRLGKLFKRRFR